MLLHCLTLVKVSRIRLAYNSVLYFDEQIITNLMSNNLITNFVSLSCSQNQRVVSLQFGGEYTCNLGQCPGVRGALDDKRTTQSPGHLRTVCMHKHICFYVII